MKDLPNHLSLLRIVLVPVFVSLLIYYTPQNVLFLNLSIAVFVFACITDAADGYIARKFSAESIIGSYIDPIADKLLLISGFFCLSFMSHLPPQMKIPAWVSVIVLSRDAIILIGALIIYLTMGALKPKPLIIGKITTGVQMLTLLACLAQLATPIKTTLFYATALFTIVSGLEYIRAGEQLLKK